MSNYRDISKLVPDAQIKANKVVKYCRSKGVNISIYTTLRSLEQTARYYRQSRSINGIMAKAVWLEDKGFDYLAKILIDVGACYGEHVTNATLGEDWHNYGEAFDSCPVDGSCNYLWDYEANLDKWATYGEAVESVGMNWGGNWGGGFKDFPHAQLRTEPNPLNVYSPDEAKLIFKNLGLL